MASIAVETPECEHTLNLGDRIADVARHATNLSDEARRLKTVAADAVEDGVHAARRAMKSVRRRVDEELGDFKDEAIHRVKRQPLPAIGAAFGVGLAIGATIAWLACWPGRRE